MTGTRQVRHFQLQPPLGAHEPEDGVDALLPIEAKEDTFSSTFLLPHAGQATSATVPAFRTSFSNSTPH